MKKIVLILFLVLNHFIAKSQINLVPNPSFEDTIPRNFSSFGSLIVEDYIINWYGGRGYFNAAYSNGFVGLYSYLAVPSNGFGHQYARTGNAYCGIYTWALGGPLRQYIQTELSQTLVVNKKYLVAFYVSLGDTFHANCNSIGAYFSTDSFFVSNDGLINQIPQIQNPNENNLSSKTEWTLVCDTFVATGNEHYITIGNFYNDSLSTYTPLDSVCSQPNPFACSNYFYIDDVSVTLIDETGMEEQRQSEFSLFPNPAKGVLNIKSTKPIKEIEVFDMQGQLIQSINSIAGLNYQLSTSNHQNGIYVLKLKNDNAVVYKRVVVIND